MGCLAGFRMSFASTDLLRTRKASPTGLIRTPGQFRSTLLSNCLLFNKLRPIVRICSSRPGCAKSGDPAKRTGLSRDNPLFHSIHTATRNGERSGSGDLRPFVLNLRRSSRRININHHTTRIDHYIPSNQDGRLEAPTATGRVNSDIEREPRQNYVKQ